MILCLHITNFTITVIYAHNVDSPDFFRDLANNLSNFSCDMIILGGDFNFVFNLDMDKVGSKKNQLQGKRCMFFFNDLL